MDRRLLLLLAVCATMGLGWLTATGPVLTAPALTTAGCTCHDGCPCLWRECACTRKSRCAPDCTCNQYRTPALHCDITGCKCGCKDGESCRCASD